MRPGSRSTAAWAWPGWKSWPAAFGEYQRPAAIPGGAVNGYTNGVQATVAVMLLNALTGNLSPEQSALWLTPPPPDPAFAGTKVAAFSDVQALIEAMRAGKIDVLMVHGNPLYELPVAAGFAEGLAKVPFVASFSSMVDETVVQSDLTLPDNSYLENWGFQFVTPPGARPAVSGFQPVVSPLYDTRATTDVLLDLAQRLGGVVKAALPYKNTVEFMKADMAKLVKQDAPYETKNADAVWAGWRQFGGWWPQSDAVTLPAAAPVVPATLEVPQADFTGSPEEFPYFLYPYLSTLLSDGRGANQPWLQEAPDPVITATWATWVEINPETAVELGLERNDLIKIITPTSMIVAIVYPYRRHSPRCGGRADRPGSLGLRALRQEPGRQRGCDPQPADDSGRRAGLGRHPCEAGEVGHQAHAAGDREQCRRGQVQRNQVFPGVMKE